MYEATKPVTRIISNNNLLQITYHIQPVSVEYASELWAAQIYCPCWPSQHTWLAPPVENDVEGLLSTLTKAHPRRLQALNKIPSDGFSVRHHFHLGIGQLRHILRNHENVILASFLKCPQLFFFTTSAFDNLTNSLCAFCPRRSLWEPHGQLCTHFLLLPPNLLVWSHLHTFGSSSLHSLSLSVVIEMWKYYSAKYSLTHPFPPSSSWDIPSLLTLLACVKSS